VAERISVKILLKFKFNIFKKNPMKNCKTKTIISISKLFFISTFLFLISVSSVQATEKIDNFETFIQINSDASLDIEERIDYNFGSLQKHGIFREIPIKYKARGGNYNLRISDIDVYDKENQKYNFEISYPGKYVKIKIGDADKYVTGEKTYIINYKIERAINYFDSYDELYWNATGNEWQIPIEKSKAAVFLPVKTEKEKLQAACFAGFLGSKTSCDKYEYIENNLAEKIIFEQNLLQPKQGLTIVVGFPKGLVSQPTKLQNFLETLKDNWILFLPLAVLIILFYLWRTRGRDPEGRKTIIVQFDPPDNLTPAEVGTIIDEKADPKDISAEIINLAVKGYLKITRFEEKRIFKKADYLLEKLKNESDLKNNFEKELMNGLFDSKDSVKLSDLKNKFYQDLAKIEKEIYQSTVDKKYFPKSPKKVRWTYFGIGIAVLFLSFFSAPLFGGLVIFSCSISAVLIILFSFFMPVKTKKGVLAKERILGLKEYLTVAEKDRIKFHNAPKKNPEHFEKLLPFAMVLGVEKQWAKQFEEIYNQQPTWYNDPSGRPFTTFALVGGLNNFQTKANSTLVSRPSSAAGGASGFGGGGFSGGGFGGGGGGSW
jgi:uncharacterized membrane protein